MELLYVRVPPVQQHQGGQSLASQVWAGWRARQEEQMMNKQQHAYLTQTGGSAANRPHTELSKHQH